MNIIKTFFTQAKSHNGTSQAIKVCTAFLVFALAVTTVSAAYEGPTTDPTDGNPPMPLNAGSSIQSKLGDLFLVNLFVTDHIGLGDMINPLKTIDVEDTGIHTGIRVRRSDNPSGVYPDGVGVSLNMGNLHPWIDFVGGLDFIAEADYSQLGRWTTGKGGNTVLSLDAENGGRVGIRTATPESELQVNGTVRAQEYCNYDGTSCSGAPTGGNGSLPDGQIHLENIKAKTGLILLTTGGTTAHGSMIMMKVLHINFKVSDITGTIFHQTMVVPILYHS
jgi:hypothetical protein